MVSSFDKCLFKLFALFKKWVSFSYSNIKVLFIFWIEKSALLVLCTANFSHSMACLPVHFLNSVLIKRTEGIL